MFFYSVYYSEGLEEEEDDKSSRFIFLLLYTQVVPSHTLCTLVLSAPLAARPSRKQIPQLAIIARRTLAAV